MMKKYDEVFARLDDLETKYIDFWKEISKIESPTLNKAGVDRVCNYIADKARERGWEVDVFPQEVAGNPICVTMNPNAEGLPICLSGHVDTVHPIGLFGEEVVTMDDTKMYGPGVTDCKGGVAAAFYAMEALQDIGFDRRPIKLIIQTDEEVSSRISNKETVKYMARMAEGCEAFLNLESYVKGYITTARKGISRYRVEVTGVAAHSSLCYDGKSAIREAAHKIIEIEKIQEKGGLTFSCGMIEGGTAENTVAEKCTFSVDVRFVDQQMMVDAEERLKHIVETSYIGGTTATLTLRSRRPAMELCDRNVELFRKLNAAFAEAGLPELKQRTSTGGSDAADMTCYGIPAIDSIGVEGGYIHSRREYGWLSSLKVSARYIAAAVCGM